jgi:hypothetical protein
MRAIGYYLAYFGPIYLGSNRSGAELKREDWYLWTSLLVCRGLCHQGTVKFSSAERREIKTKGKKKVVATCELSF